MIYVDQGASFDGGREQPPDEWVEWLRGKIAGLPDGHPAREYLAGILWSYDIPAVA